MVHPCPSQTFVVLVEVSLEKQNYSQLFHTEIAGLLFQYDIQPISPLLE